MSSLPQDPGRRRRSDRRFERVAISIPGVLEGRAAHPIEVVELSLGGCLVRSSHRPEPGAIQDLRFDLGAEAFVAKARVCEASLDGEVEGGGAYLLGLEFLSLSASDQDLLRQFFDSKSRRSPRGARPAP